VNCPERGGEGNIDLMDCENCDRHRGIENGDFVKCMRDGDQKNGAEEL
jgi:hypothetical protein